MRTVQTHLLRALLLAALCCASAPLHALVEHAEAQIGEGAASLTVCNKGTVKVIVAKAHEEDVLNWLEVNGWKPVDPGKCVEVYSTLTEGDANEYFAFGIYDSRNQLVAAHATQVPDAGTYPVPLFRAAVEKALDLPVWSRSNRKICASFDGMSYRVGRNQAIDCPNFHPDASSYFAFETALLFHPLGSRCANPYHCSGGDYYLNIAPKPGDRELHATAGTETAADAPPRDPDLDDPVKAMKKFREALDALQLKQYPACNVITKVEAESVLGVSIDPPQPGRTLCRYQEPGYGTDPSKKKQVTIGIWRSTAAAAEDVNNRRDAIIKDKSLLPVSYKELPDFGDAALWVWAGGYYGALYAFRGGMVEVAVKISGVPENVALTTAKKFAARALGGTSKTGFAYAARRNPQ